MMKTKVSRIYNNGNFEETTMVEEVIIETPVLPVVIEKGTRGKLMSRLPQPATISYKGESTIVPAQGTSRPLDSRFLGALPKGVIFIRLKD